MRAASFGYLLDRGCIQDLTDYQEECLDIFSREVLKLIREEDPAWESMVPESVAKVIKSRHYAGA